MKIILIKMAQFIVLYGIFIVALLGYAPSFAQSLSPRFKFSIDGFYDEPFGEPMGVFVDGKNKEVYVVDMGKGEVFVFDTSGTPLFRFGLSAGIVSPVDIAAVKDRVYISQEGKSYVEVFNLRGARAGELLHPEGEFSPGRMDIDEEGNVYVVNRKLGECYVFDGKGNFLRTIGKGLFFLSGVAVEGGGDRVYLIAPFYGGRVVHVYDKKGGHIMSFEGIAERGGTLGLPVSAKVDSSGNLWIADSLKGIIVYDRDGKKAAAFGRGGASFDRLDFPVDVDFGSDGMIYIVDKERKGLRVFK